MSQAGSGSRRDSVDREGDGMAGQTVVAGGWGSCDAVGSTGDTEADHETRQVQRVSQSEAGEVVTHFGIS